MPKIDVAAVSVRKGSGYPPPFDAPVQHVRGNAGATRADFAISASI